MNVVVLRGTVSSEPRHRELPSGSGVTQIEVTTRSTDLTTSVPVAIHGRQVTCRSGDEIVVVGLQQAEIDARLPACEIGEQRRHQLRAERDEEADAQLVPGRMALVVFRGYRNGAPVAPVGVDQRRTLGRELDLLDLADEDEMRSQSSAVFNSQSSATTAPSMIGAPVAPGCQPIAPKRSSFRCLSRPEKRSETKLWLPLSTFAQNRRLLRIASQAGLR